MEAKERLRNKAFERAQAEILFSTSNFVALGQLVMGAIVAFVLAQYTDLNSVLTWAGFVLFTIILRFSLNYLYSQKKGPARILWSRLYAMVSLLAGTAWGTMVLLNVGVQNFYIIDLILAGTATSVMMTSPIYKPASFSYSSIAILSIIIYSYFNPDRRYISYVYLTSGYAVFLYIFLQRTHKSMVDSVNLRFENDFLLEELMHEKDAALLATKKAETANLAKSKFLATASHDLRQPLHALGLFFYALKNTKTKQESERIYSSMNNSIVSLNELLNALLDMSKLDAGAIEIHKKAISLRDVIYRIVNEYLPQANDKNIVLRHKVADASIYTDPIWFERILRNLISNALRYTDSGKILISGRKRSGKILLQFWDTGIGIKSESLDIIFDEFQQLQNPHRDRTQGLGLGLAIVKRLCHLLGFAISVKSQCQRGTVFSILLPQSEQLADSFENQELTPGVTLKGKCVLLIDDEKEIHEAMTLVLKKWGCEVYCAEGLDSSLENINQCFPDIIISDYRLANHNTGIQVLEQIENYTNELIPCLLITGETSPEIINEINKSGYKVLHKPVNSLKLRLMLNSLLAKDESSVCP